MNAEFNQLMADLQKKWEKNEQERAEEASRKQAEWDALPEEEKKLIISEREQKRREWEKRQAEQEWEKQIQVWRGRGITPRYYDSAWENFKVETPEQKSALEKVKQAWGKNLFIIGGNGTGKTHLAMCLAKDGATYCLMPELFRTVRENLDIEQQTINKYGTCKLLLLDEAGRQKGTEFEKNLLFEIIDKRWNYMLPTTIIGNIDKREFANLYGSAIVDRLRPESVVFNWQSKRRI